MKRAVLLLFSAIALPKAVRLVRDGVRRDRANAYALLEPWPLPPLGGDLPELGLMPPAPYADERLRVEFSTQRRGDAETPEPCDSATLRFITILPWELDSRECDGCTLAPDTWGELKLYVAALFHDRWYLSMESIAKAWGWDVARVRKLGDIVFATILVDLADAWARDLRSRPCSWLRAGVRELEILGARASVAIYYRGVRAFGGAAHRIMAALLLSLALSGCAGGCAAPEAWDEDARLAPPPAVAFTNAVTGAHFATGEGE